MKRDMDLILRLLLCLEEKQSSRPEANVCIQGYSKEEIGYHLALLAQAGYIDYEAFGSLSNGRKRQRSGSASYSHPFSPTTVATTVA